MKADTNHRGTETQRFEEADPGSTDASFALSQRVIGCAIEVHRVLGPGLLESAYELALAHEMHLQDLAFERQMDFPVVYKGHELAQRYRPDMVVEGKLLLELKAVESLLPLHTAQVLTYLRLTRIKTALLINFNVPVLKHGIRRISL